MQKSDLCGMSKQRSDDYDGKNRLEDDQMVDQQTEGSSEEADSLNVPVHISIYKACDVFIIQFGYSATC